MSEMQPESGYTITVKDLFAQVSQLVGEVRSLTESFRYLNEAKSSAHADYEMRLRALERWRYALPATLFVSIGSVITAVLALFLKH